LVIGRLIRYIYRPPTPLNGAYCNKLLLAHFSVRQKLKSVSSVQFGYVALYAPLE